MLEAEIEGLEVPRKVRLLKAFRSESGQKPRQIIRA